MGDPFPFHDVARVLRLADEWIARLEREKLSVNPLLTTSAPKLGLG